MTASKSKLADSSRTETVALTADGIAAFGGPRAVGSGGGAPDVVVASHGADGHTGGSSPSLPDPEPR